MWVHGPASEASKLIQYGWETITEVCWLLVDLWGFSREGGFMGMGGGGG